MIFTNRLSPWVFHFMVGGHEFGVRWYGAAYAAGFLFGFYAFRLALKRGELKPATDKINDRLLTAIIFGVLVGGRLGFVLQNMDRWREDPLFVFKVYEGGMAFFGGLLGVILALAWVGKLEKIKMLALTDVATAPAMAGLFVGRLANFANRELWGRPTHGNWGVIYPNIDAQPRHPSELYEATSHLLAFLLLLLARRVAPDWCLARPGRLSALFLIFYGVFRFITDFWREEPLMGGIWGTLNSGQVASLLVAALGVGIALFVFPTRPAVPGNNAGVQEIVSN